MGSDPYDAPPMTEVTPQHSLNPGDLARARASVEYRVVPDAFVRLGTAVARHEEAVTVGLRFAPVRGGGIRVRGMASTTVIAACQTCLEELQLTLAAEIDLLLHSEAEVLEAQPIDQDTLQYAEGVLGCTDLVEDQLLLELPMVPRHGTDCMDTLDYTAPPAPELRRSSPFDALRDIDLPV